MSLGVLLMLACTSEVNKACRALSELLTCPVHDGSVPFQISWEEETGEQTPAQS